MRIHTLNKRTNPTIWYFQKARNLEFKFRLKFLNKYRKVSDKNLRKSTP